MFLVALASTMAILPGAVFAALPPDALKVLNTFPEKKVTLPLVLSRGMETSDSFRAVRASAIAIDAPKLEALGVLDPQFTMSANKILNRNEPQTPFSPNKIDGTEFTLGVMKRFRSGTATQFTFKNGRTDLGFAAVAGLPINDFGYYESKATLALTQDLWRNSMGSAVRETVRAGEARTEAAREDFYTKVLDWQKGLRAVFYQAWLAQSQSKLAHDTTARRKRLVEVIRIRLNRGTSERPDLLQVESAELQTRTQEAATLQLLGDRWRGLVISLKLPEDWIRIDPKDIPIGLDQPFEKAKKFCAEFESNAMPGETIALRKAKAESRAAEGTAAAAKDQLRPALYVQGELSGNDIDFTSRETTLGNAFRLVNPAWAVSLNLAVPLSNSAGQAQVRKAGALAIAADAIAAQTAADVKLLWANGCADYARAESSYKLLKHAHESQTKRAELEEQRFRIGRSTTQFVILAQDDAASAENMVLMAEVERRQAAWNVVELHPSYRESLDRMTREAMDRE